MKQNSDFIENFYLENPGSLDVHVFAGKNGSGKTFLLNQIFESNGLFVVEEENEQFILGKEKIIDVIFEGKPLSFQGEISDKFRRIFFSNSLEVKKIVSHEHVQENDGNEYAEDLSTVTKLLGKKDYSDIVEADIMDQVNFINSLQEHTMKNISKLLDLPKDIVTEVPNIKKMRFLEHPIFNYIDDSQTIKDFFLDNELKGQLNDLQKVQIIDSKRNFIIEVLEIDEPEEDINVIEELKKITNSKTPKINLEELISTQEIHEEVNYDLEDLKNKYYLSMNIIEQLSDASVLYEGRKEIVIKSSIIKNRHYFRYVCLLKEHYVELKKPYWYKISSGQYFFLNLFARINSSKFKKEEKSLTMILIDEVDLGLHPAWQRKWMKHVPTILSEIFHRNEIQLIITTHSPVILSDILDQDVKLLGDDVSDQGICDFKTFGNNIHELMANQFFLDEGVIGAFAKDKIASTIKLLKESVNDSKKITEEELREYEVIANAVGEQVIKNELKRLLLRIKNKKINYYTDPEFELGFNEFKEILRKVKQDSENSDEKESDSHESDID